VALMLQPQLPAVATMLRDAKEEITAFADFPQTHWVKVWSTNPLERLNKEPWAEVIGGTSSAGR